MKDMNKEIAIVEKIIELLNECLKLHILNYELKSAMDCKKDIAFCKSELNRLKLKRNNEHVQKEKSLNAI